jgi:ParB-like chromosome segregation protein Spo0J
MDIQRIPAAKLRAAKYNPRKDLKPGDPEFEKLRRSIEEFGYVEPVIWNKRTGNIVGGHQRFAVLKHLGHDEIDCVVVDLDDAREKALNVALNKISGAWDMEKLKDLFEGIDDGAFDVTLTGFDLSEIDALAVSLTDDLDDIDAKREPTLGGSYLSLGKVKIPLTEDEKAAFTARLESYVERNGVPFGFVGDLLGA